MGCQDALHEAADGGLPAHLHRAQEGLWDLQLDQCGPTTLSPTLVASTLLLGHRSIRQVPLLPKDVPGVETNQSLAPFFQPHALNYNGLPPLHVPSALRSLQR